jgi:nucleotide-binding universal stress UspA family protein
VKSSGSGNSRAWQCGPLLRRQGGSEEIILRQVLAGGHDLVVMGVSRRPGEALTFGGAASAVIAQDKISVLLVSSKRPA